MKKNIVKKIAFFLIAISFCIICMNLSISKAKISDFVIDEYVLNEHTIEAVPPATTVETFLSKVLTNQDCIIYNRNRQKQNLEFVFTGDVLETNEKEYVIIVKRR